jgi:prepilin-type processing-associated H-X9-DG protein
MTCPHCGTTNNDSAAACSACGAALGGQPAGVPAPPPPPPPYLYGTPPPSRGKSSSSHIWLIVCAAGCLLMVPIIAIMAAILFPVFAKARTKAVQTSCLSNVRQLCTAQLSYAQDWKEAFPQGANWCDATEPYVRNREVYSCPSRGASIGGDYWMSRPVCGVSLDRFKSPSEAGLLFEGSSSRWNGSGGKADVRAPHNGGANYGFVDGHAKWLRDGSAPDALWNPAFGPPGAAPTPIERIGTPSAPQPPAPLPPAGKPGNWQR